MKRCPGCDTRLPREAFFDEPHDTVTGLSALCRSCVSKQSRRPAKRAIRGWWTTSPAGLRGDVLNVREEDHTIVVRFKGARTVVMPMVEEAA